VGAPARVAAAPQRPTVGTVSATSPSPQKAFGGATPDQRDRLNRDRLLFERYRDPGDAIDRDAIVERFLPLARQLAAGYAHGTEPFDDLFQVACLALVRAVDRFDLERHTAFSSYAVPTILGELKRYFRDKTWAVRVPRDLQDLGLRVQRAAERMTVDLGRSPTIEELADAVDATPEEVLEAREAIGAYHATSLDVPRGDEDDDTLADFLGRQDTGYQRAEQRALLDDLLRCLTLREREVVRLRFEEDLTQREIGDRVGVSQMQVSRILRESIARLREVHADDVRWAA
jgi:RNA polymerase sigma-B factor